MLTENARTVEAASALANGDLQRMGQLMAESHASMRDDFEITVPQIDTLVEIVKAVIGDQGGVRMTGGGFGGCIVALIPEALVEKVQQAVAAQYEAKTGIKETFTSANHPREPANANANSRTRARRTAVERDNAT